MQTKAFVSKGYAAQFLVFHAGDLQRMGNAGGRGDISGICAGQADPCFLPHQQGAGQPENGEQKPDQSAGPPVQEGKRLHCQKLPRQLSVTVRPRPA